MYEETISVAVVVISILAGYVVYFLLQKKAEEVAGSPTAEPEKDAEQVKPAESESAPSMTNGEASKEELAVAEKAEAIPEVTEPTSSSEEKPESAKTEEKPEETTKVDETPSATSTVPDEPVKEVGSETLASNSPSETSSISNPVTVRSQPSVITAAEIAPETHPEVVATEGSAESQSQTNESPIPSIPTFSPEDNEGNIEPVVAESKTETIENVVDDHAEVQKDSDIPEEKPSNKSLNSEISDQSSTGTLQISVKTEESDSTISMPVSSEEQMPVVSSAGDVILNPNQVESDVDLIDSDRKLDFNSETTHISFESNDLSTIKEAPSENSRETISNESIIEPPKEIIVEQIERVDSLPDLSSESLPSLPPEPISESLPEPMSLPPIESLPEPIANDIDAPPSPVPADATTNGLTNGVNGLCSPEDKSEEIPPPVALHTEGSTKQVIADVPLENVSSNADNSETKATTEATESVVGGD